MFTWTGSFTNYEVCAVNEHGASRWVLSTCYPENSLMWMFQDGSQYDPNGD